MFIHNCTFTKPLQIIPFSQEDTTHNNTCSQNTSYIPKSQLNNSVRWRLSWGQNSICMAPLFLSETTACPLFILTQSVRFLSMHAGKTREAWPERKCYTPVSRGLYLENFQGAVEVDLSSSGRNWKYYWNCCVLVSRWLIPFEQATTWLITLFWAILPGVVGMYSTHFILLAMRWGHCAKQQVGWSWVLTGNQCFV